MDKKPLYPNDLKEARTKAMISQRQLALKCQQLAEIDPSTYVRLSTDSIKDLEAGNRRPRRNSAATLGEALAAPAKSLFPNGFDDTHRNPSGRPRSTPN